MKIDGHAHACGVYANDNSIQTYLSEHHIDKVILSAGEPNQDKNYSYPMFSSVFKGEGLGYFFNKIICKVVQINQVATHLNEQNEAIYHIAKEMPEQVINTYWVNPEEEDCVLRMDAFYQDKSFKMIKLHQCWTEFEVNSKVCTDIYYWAYKHQVPVFIHLLDAQQVRKFVEIANIYHMTTFIVAHMLGSDYMGENLQYDNVYFDLSAPQLYSSNMLERAIHNFGASRLLLGSDSPYGVDNIDKVQKRIQELQLSQSDMDLICGGNVLRLLQEGV